MFPLLIEQNVKTATIVLEDIETRPTPRLSDIETHPTPRLSFGYGPFRTAGFQTQHGDHEHG